MLLLDQMSGGHVVGRNVFSTTFLLFPLTYAHAFSLPPLLKDIARFLSSSLPYPFLRKKKVFGIVLIINSRFRIKCKEYGNALFNELHCWINDLCQQCSLISKFEELWSNMMLMFFPEILFMQVNLIEMILNITPIIEMIVY